MVLESKKDNVNIPDNSGFSLIELLVVIAITAMLLAILLPVLGKARQISKRIVCQSNLKQISTAWQMYLDDNEGKFFQGMDAQFIYGGWEGIIYMGRSRPLNKYLSLPPTPKSESEAEVFRCPSDTGDTDLPYYVADGTSYKTNILLIGQNRIGWLPSRELKNAINSILTNLTLTQVDNPTRLLLIGDSGWGTQWMPSPYPRGVYWHGGRCHYNVAFLDGHVEFIQIRKGLYITDEYTVLPVKELYELARQVQAEEP